MGLLVIAIIILIAIVLLLLFAVLIKWYLNAISEKKIISTLFGIIPIVLVMWGIYLFASFILDPPFLG